MTCFEPTYKELKPATCFLNALVQLCFEPTYKELKPVNHQELWDAIEKF